MILRIGIYVRPIRLGVKWEECLECGGITEQTLIRTTGWFHVFYLPILLVYMKHGLVCGRCGAWTSLRWKEALHAARSGFLPLPWSRASFEELRDELWSLTGKRPTQADVLDVVQVNRHRGRWDFYTKAWPAMIVLLIVAVIAFPRQAGTLIGNPEATYGKAHECWASQSEPAMLNGCRLDDGTTVGEEGGSPVTCYFDEPLPADVETLRCE